MRRLLLALALGLATLFTVRVQRGFPWGLSAIVGLAAAILAGMTFATTDRLIRLWRGDRQPPEA